MNIYKFFEGICYIDLWLFKRKADINKYSCFNNFEHFHCIVTCNAIMEMTQTKILNENIFTTNNRSNKFSRHTAYMSHPQIFQ